VFIVDYYRSFSWQTVDLCFVNDEIFIIAKDVHLGQFRLSGESLPRCAITPTSIGGKNFIN
jgi:hypothetical protein